MRNKKTAIVILLVAVCLVGLYLFSKHRLKEVVSSNLSNVDLLAPSTRSADTNLDLPLPADLPEDQEYQHVRLDDNVSFKWPRDWKAERSVMLYHGDPVTKEPHMASSTLEGYEISLFDNANRKVAVVECPSLRIEGPYGVEDLYSGKRSISKNGTVYTFYYSEYKDDTAKHNAVLGVMIEIKNSSCELLSEDSVSLNFSADDIAALRHLFYSFD